MIKYSIATSWKNKLIDGIYNLNQKTKGSQIVEIYGSLQKSLIGSGRPAYRLPFVSLKQAREHISYAHEHNLNFNYALNAPDFRGKEKNAQWLKRAIRFITKLESLGVDILTITNPVLIKLVKNKFPKLKTNLSLIAGVDTVRETKKYEEMGVDIIYLNPHTINRNIKQIKKIIKSTKCKIGLYANIPCLDHCPYRDAHYNFFGHASQEHEKMSKTNYDPFIVGCSLIFLNQPIEFLKSPFIRPEDISEYAKLGISKFKLADRSESTESLLNTAKTYMEQCYEGNLFDLIFRKGSKFKAGIKMIYPEVTNLNVPIFIDNNQLTKLNFLKQTKKLKGKKLEKFYKKITNLTVKYLDEQKIDKLKNLLQRI